MNIRDLKYLVALSQHRHFGKAALACHVSQPALSIQIKKFEERLGVQLLERTNKSVMLTEIGKTLAKHAEHILIQTDAFHELAQYSKDPFCGELKLGVIPSVAPYLLPHILQKLALKFPKLKFYLVEWPTEGLIVKLEQGIIDAAILPLPMEQPNINVSPFYEEELFLAVPSSHPFSRRKSIHQNELQNESLLLLDDGHCMSEPLRQLCQQVKATEINNFRATSLETLRHMVAIGMGMTLMPKLACKCDDTLSYVSINNAKPVRSLGMAWRNTTGKSYLLREVLNYSRRILAKNKAIKIL